MKNQKFLNISIQYYLAARAVSLALLVPVGANLYHHAIETLLKTIVEGKFSHDIPSLWRIFKLFFPGRTLDKFDILIADLHEWEEIRYPDHILSNVNMVVDGIKRISVHITPNPSKSYNLSVEDMDKLYKELWNSIGIGPKYFLGYLNSPELRKLYEESNKHMIY